MKHQVNSKLLILFGIVCGIFFSVNSVLAADAITNKSSTFGTKMTKQQISSSGDTDSALAEKIRAQRAAIDARENREANESQNKSGAKSNSCDNDLRKCIESQCGASYKKCETDTDTTFSDKLNACRKKTNCTAHEFAMFVPEIKEDKKQEIRLAEYNKVLDCGNSYNNCIITECGIRFNKCLSKSAGDKAIAKCKSIATDCTEADSGLTSRIGSVFGTVRQNAEKQVKADEKKLYELRDKMRKSCESLGAMFDERSFDCVFSVSFSSGSDDKTFNASKKLYAGSLFDCTPDWFGIDVTTFKENAYRLTRAQTAASSAMLGSGLGTAAGALASGAIDRAIQTKKAKDALSEECEKAGKTVKDGKCVDKDEEEDDDDNNDNADNNDTNSEKPKDENPNRQPCTSEQRNANINELIYANETEFKDGKCIPVNCKSGYTLEGTTCVETEEDEIQYCKSEEAKKLNAKVATKDKDGKCVPTACIDNTYELSGGKCKKLSDKDICEKVNGGTWNNKKCEKPQKETQKPSDNNTGDLIAQCALHKGTWQGNTCKCNNNETCDKWWNSAKPKAPTQKDVDGAQCTVAGGHIDIATGKCLCANGKSPVDGKCGSKTNNSKNTKQTNTKKPTEDELTESAKKAAVTVSPKTEKVSEVMCNGRKVLTAKANTSAELRCVSHLTATNICYADNKKTTGQDIKCDPKTKNCAYSCYDMSGKDKTYYIVCCNINNSTETISCKGINKTGTNTSMTGPKISISDCN